MAAHSVHARRFGECASSLEPLLPSRRCPAPRCQGQCRVSLVRARVFWHTPNTRPKAL